MTITSLEKEEIAFDNPKVYKLNHFKFVPKVRILLTCFLLISGSLAIAQSSFSRVPDSLTYKVINTFCMENHHKRISRVPVRYVFYDGYDSTDPSGYRKTGTDIFLERVKEWDTSMVYFIIADYPFMKHQIDTPPIQYMDHRRIDSTRVKRKQRFIPATYAISLPVFTKDMQSAIIAGNYWGMSRVFLYRLDPVTKQWKLYTMLWQDGS